MKIRVDTMGKTITISDDVYWELVRLKGKRSFSEVIRELIKKKGNTEILLIGFKTRSVNEAEELERELRETEKWMRSLTQV